MAANRARMDALGLAKLSSELEAPKRSKRAPTKRGVRPPRVPVGERRRSRRVAKEAPDAAFAAGVLNEHRDGSVELASGARVGAGGDVGDAPPPGPTRPTGDLSFDSAECDEAEDAAFIEQLARAAALPADAKKAPSPPPATRAKTMELAEEDVVKACRKGVVHLEFLPRADASIVAAGDKSGNLGLWAYDAAFAERDEADGVRLLKPHGQYISGLTWKEVGSGAPPTLLTASYDGVVRSMDAETGTSSEVLVLDGHEGRRKVEISAFDAFGELAYVASNEGDLGAVDMRAKGLAWKRDGLIEAHHKKINTVDIERGSAHLLATSSTDATVKIWDVRKLGGAKAKPVAELGLARGSQGATWAPDGSKRLLVITWNDDLQVYGNVGQAGRKGAELLGKVHHKTKTGRYTIPLRPKWLPRGDGFVCGGMNRTLDFFDASAKKLGQLSSEFLTAIQSRVAIHPYTGVVCSASNSGRLHMFKH